MPQFKALIIGAGLGSLCLAQTLRKAHIDVEVYERDASSWTRPQGYRLHLEADALNGLREVLPVELHRLFEATAMRTELFTTILNTDLSVAKRIPSDDGQDAHYWPEFVSDESIHCNVDRGTLRNTALLGLEECCHFNKPLTSYQSTEEGVVATFADGTSASGHVLIGADGIHSAGPGRKPCDARCGASRTAVEGSRRRRKTVSGSTQNLRRGVLEIRLRSCARAGCNGAAAHGTRSASVVAEYVLTADALHPAVRSTIA